MNKKNIVLFSILVSVIGSPLFGAGKVYTNKDLERYNARSSTPAAPYESSKISVDFRDAEVFDVLRVMAEVVKKKDNVDILVSPEIYGRITIKSIDVPWSEILKEISRKHNLTTAQVGKRTFVVYSR